MHGWPSSLCLTYALNACWASLMWSERDLRRSFCSRTHLRLAFAAFSAFFSASRLPMTRAQVGEQAICKLVYGSKGVLQARHFFAITHTLHYPGTSWLPGASVSAARWAIRRSSRPLPETQPFVAQSRRWFLRQTSGACVRCPGVRRASGGA